ncbi:recombinase family protein [Clostridium botulinum]|uniref:recombinase family protein n=1 Tax=Clostridium botulinum TaxID=1491 RepID=UPI001C9B6F41|nr:recombinase family protein [Clostridium botulinum]MBY6915453.1 recombinase family protein [Clostridium botulinum]
MNIAIYTRKSVYIENSESIETQINLCKSYFNNIECNFEVFEDEGFSGKNTNRPAFTRMMKLCKLGKFDIVAVYKIDRIARNIIDFVNIYDSLEKDNIKLVSITEGFDPSTPGGKIQMILLASLADMERMNIAQRVKDNMLSLAKKGCWTGGPAPKGYEIIKDYENGKSYLQLEDKNLILNLFNWYLENQSLYKVMQLMKENYPPNKAYSIRENIRAFLRNPLYVQSDPSVSEYLKLKGFVIVGTENKKGYLTYGKTKGQSMAIVSKHKAVITPTLFLQVNRLLDEKRESYFKKDSKTYWLSATMKCPFCKADYILCNSGRKSYYVCSNRLKRTSLGLDTKSEKCKNNKYVNAEVIEAKVEKFIDTLKDVDKDEFKKMYEKDTASFDVSLDLERKIKENEKLIDNLIEKLMLLSNEAAKPITNKIEELTKFNSQLKIKLENEKLKTLELEANKYTSENIFDNICSFSSIKDNNQKRIALRNIFKFIIYNPFNDSLEVEFL